MASSPGFLARTTVDAEIRVEDDFLSAIVIDDTNEEEHDAAGNEETEDAAKRVAAVGTGC